MVKYLGGPISEEEFYLRVECSGKIKVEYARKWQEEHGYKHYSEIPTRGKVARDKYLDGVIGTEEARKKVEDLIASRRKK